MVANVPSGESELTAVVCTWEHRTVTLAANEKSVSVEGLGDQTGIPVSIDITIGVDQQLTISASSTGQWWVEGHEGETQTFFKLDNVRLTCKSIFLNGYAQPLPNDKTTVLQPKQWYYYDSDYRTEYRLTGNLEGLVCSPDGQKLLSDIVTSPAEREMTLARGRHYFMATRSDATLSISKTRYMQEGELTAVALNVDGLPAAVQATVLGFTVKTIDLNPDGPMAEGSKLISQYLASKNYDLIGFSEDFNFHSELMSLLSGYSAGTQRATIPAKVEVLSSGVDPTFDTDGLNLIWKNSACTASKESWTKWNQTTSTDGNQYIKKGYRHYDLTLPDGTIIDVYILHMDAGEATDSREAQWRQLAEAVNATDSSRPKLILGDTNSRWTREDIASNFMARLNKSLIATDVWVEFFRDGHQPTTDMADLTDQSNPENYANYEVVDKIIYVNPWIGNTVQLVPQTFRIEQDYTYDTVDHDGNTKPLGDHRPVVVTFKILKSGDLIGDVNHDGLVNVVDAVEIVNYILGRPSADFDVTVANLNGDQEVTVADAVTVLDMILP
jgi:exonuclease III